MGDDGVRMGGSSATSEARISLSTDGRVAALSVTVLIATRRRAASLRRTLESLLCPSNLETAGWEVLVITQDFDCQESLQVCKDFRTRFPHHFRFMLQQKTGKSNAVNLGIALARGELLALSDDDMIFCADYIRSIREVFERYSPDAVQGRIVLECAGGLPGWMAQRQRIFMGFCDYGDEVMDWTRNALYGGNMVVRAEAVRKVGGFSLQLGAGSRVGFAEDTEFSYRLRAAGCRFLYAPAVIARHQLERKRLTRWFFRKRYFGLGKARAYIDPIEGVPLWRYGLYSAKYAVLELGKALWHRVRNRPAEALDAECCAFQNTGFFLQHVRFWLGEPRRLSIVKVWPGQPVNCTESGAVEASATKL